MARVTVALGVAVMILAVLILEGFEKEIKAKVFGFVGSMSIATYSGGDVLAEKDIVYDAALLERLKKIQGIESAEGVCFRPALLKTKSEVQGIVLKGYSNSRGFSGIIPFITKGRLPKTGSVKLPFEEVCISLRLAGLLDIREGEELNLYFLQNPPRYRKVKVVGFYSTDLEEFDNHVLLTDAGLIQSLNDWTGDRYSQIEIKLNEPEKRLDIVQAEIEKVLPYDKVVVPVTRSYIQIFEWLSMIGRNVELLLFLVTVVACFNIVSTLLIMILERTAMIGTLMSLGSSQGLLRQIFIGQSLKWVVQGLLAGNVIALILGYIQFAFKPVTLDAENYYIAYVPISWSAAPFIWVNLLVIFSALLALALPSALVARIKPVKAIKFQ